MPQKIIRHRDTEDTESGKDERGEAVGSRVEDARPSRSSIVNPASSLLCVPLCALCVSVSHGLFRARIAKYAPSSRKNCPARIATSYADARASRNGIGVVRPAARI